MASENPKQEDMPPLCNSSSQSNEEQSFFHLQNGSNLTPIFNVEAEQDHYCLTRDEHLIPESYGQGMPVHVINDDVSVFPETGDDYLSNPVSDFSVSIGNMKGFDLNHAFEDSADATNKWANDLDSFQIKRNIVDSGTDVGRASQTYRLDGEYNSDGNCRPWLIGSQIAHADRAPVSFHNPTSGELGPSSPQIHRAGEVNDCNVAKPWVTRNQFFQAGSASVSGCNPASGEFAISNNFMTSTAQPDHPEINANFLSLGFGTNKETSSECNDPSRDSKQNIERVVSPTLNAFSDQNIAKGTYSVSSATTTGFSTFNNFAGGFTRLANKNPCQAQKVDRFSSLVENAAVFPPSQLEMQKVEPALNVGGPSNQAQNRDIPSGLLKINDHFSQPSGIESGGTLPLLEDGQEYDHIPSSWNLGQGEKMCEGFANIDSNASFQVFSTDLSMPYNGIGMPDAAWYGATRAPSSSSMVGFTSQPTSGRLQNPHIRAVRNFSPGPYIARSFAGVPGSMSWLGQSGPVMVPSDIGVPRSMVHRGQLGPVGVPSEQFPRSMSCQGQSGQSVQANTGSAAQATEGSPFSKKIRVQPAYKGSHGESQALVAVKPFKSSPAHAHTADQEIQEVNLPYQPSSVYYGPSRKRGASILPRSAPGAQRRKTRSTIPYNLSTPAIHQIRPPHALPTSTSSLSPQVYLSVPSRPPLSQARPYLPRKSPSLHIKWQDKDKTSLSGLHCPICKRDLSYTAEGPMFQPENLVPTSVLPCGHYFHTSCLLRITPADQAGDPPCIPCALGEKI